MLSISIPTEYKVTRQLQLGYFIYSFGYNFSRIVAMIPFSTGY